MSIINTFFKIFGLTLLGFLLLALLVGFCSFLDAIVTVVTGSKLAGFLFYLFTSFAAVISLALTSIKYVDTYL